MSLELQILELSGTPRQMGEIHGEHLREKISDFVQMRFHHLNEYLKDRGSDFRRRRLQRIGRESMEIHRKWNPAGIIEHDAIARAANVDALDLYLATNMTDMRDAFLLSAASGPRLSKATGDGEGCTSLLIPPSETGALDGIAGQTWDLNPPDVEFVFGFHRKGDELAESFSISCCGCLSLMGMNEFGVCVGTTNIKTYGATSGVGYLGILHAALHMDSSLDAAELVRSAPVAGAHTYWIADGTHQFELEISPNGAFERDTKDGAIWRTNHCLAPAHKEVEGEVISESSQKRFETVAERVPSVRTMEDTKRLFSDRSEGVHSINRYPEDEQGTATNAVLIAEPGRRRVSVCRGPADRGEWQTICFD